MRKLIAPLIISGLIMASITGTALGHHYTGTDQFCRNGENAAHAHGHVPDIAAAASNCENE